MMTYGEQAVGLSFNPNGDKNVEWIKKLYAEIINVCNDLRDCVPAHADAGEHKRLFGVAITEAQTAQMWAVKAITYKSSELGRTDHATRSRTAGDASDALAQAARAGESRDDATALETNQYA